MFTCWMLIGLVQGVGYYDEARRQQVQALKLETQLALESLRVLRMQLNPHFLFNTLHSISTLIEDEPKVAEEMILRLSHLLRSILDENKQEISLREELGFLEDHLAIEKVRFGDRLQTTVLIEDALLDCAVPQLILQPLVENVIQHGIGRHQGNDSIEITASQKSDLLHIEVKNYNSRLNGTLQPSSRVGIGLSNTRMRLETLYRDRCFLDMDRLPPSGFVVRLSVPLRMISKTENEFKPSKA
jgi:two-component system LytT family sensor kinase